MHRHYRHSQIQTEGSERERQKESTQGEYTYIDRQTATGRHREERKAESDRQGDTEYPRHLEKTASAAAAAS